MLTSEIAHRFDLGRQRGESDDAWGERIGGAVQWCIARHGGPGFVSQMGEKQLIIVGGYYTFSGVVFYFSRDADALEFKMRWG